MKYRIYYGSREYAKICGDPLLGEVEADSKEDAEDKAIKLGLNDVPGVGVWACPTKLFPGERIDFDEKG